MVVHLGELDGLKGKSMQMEGVMHRGVVVHLEEDRVTEYGGAG